MVLKSAQLQYRQAKNVTESARWNWALILKENFNIAVNDFEEKKFAWLSRARCNRTRCKRYPIYLQMSL